MLTQIVVVTSGRRFLPQGGTWDVADVQWNPHRSHVEYIVSTSSEKLYVPVVSYRAFR